jgi:hypothetical protein
VPVADDLLADAKHHRTVPAHERREGPFRQLVAIGDESREQLTITRFLGDASRSNTRGWKNDGFNLPVRHDMTSQERLARLQSYWEVEARLFHFSLLDRPAQAISHFRSRI